MEKPKVESGFDKITGMQNPLPGTQDRRGRDMQLMPALEVAPIVEVEDCVWMVDVRPLLELAHSDWNTEMLRVAKAAEQKSIEGGSVGTSMAPSDFRTVYHPTNGLTIARELPWVLELYRNEFRDIVERTTGDSSVHLGRDLAHSLNMNLTRPDKSYELHTDRNPWTALLAVTTVGEGEGGETIFWPESIFSDTPDLSLKSDLTPDALSKVMRWEGLSIEDKLKVWREFEIWDILHPKKGKSIYTQVAVIRPEAGFLYVFNGRTQLHEVTAFKPNNSDRLRLTVPGDYYTDAVEEVVDPEFNKKIGVGK